MKMAFKNIANSDYPTKWLWIPITLIIVSLLIPIFHSILLDGASEHLRLQIIFYIFLNFFLLFLIKKFKKRVVHIVIGIIYLLFFLCFVFGSFSNSLILGFYSRMDGIAGFICVPQLVAGLILISKASKKSNSDSNQESDW